MPQLNSDPFAGFGESSGETDPFSGFGPEAPLPKAIGAAASADPQKAGEAITLANQTGAPATVIHADPEGFKQQLRSTEASHFVQSNPHIANFIGSYPLGAEVAVDDYDNMDKISTTGTKLNDHPVIKHVLDAMTEGFGGPLHNITPEQREAFPRLSKAMEPLVPLVQFPEAAMRVIGSGLYGGAEALSELLTAGGVEPTTANRIKREAINFAGFLMAESGAKAGEPGRVPQLTPAAKAHIDAGETPPPGVDKITDHLHNIQAHLDAANMDKAVEAVEGSKMKERSPAALEEYLTQILGDKEVSIPVEAVNELYKDTTPGPGDGVLGLDPNKLTLANASGADVQVKLSKLLAELEGPTYEKLRDNIRHREEGVTLEEAKELDLEPTKLAEGEEPEKPLSVREQVKKSFYFQPLFENAKAIGMDEAQYKKYFDRFVEADNVDLRKAVAKAELRRKRELTPEWKAAESSIRQEVTDEFTGLDIINQAFNGATPRLELSAKIDAEVQARLESRFGGNLSNLILDDARESALASHYIDLMDSEYKALAAAKGDDTAISLSEMKQWVKGRFADMTRKEASYETFRRGAENGYKDAAEAVLGGKFDEALKAQQRRIVSSLMAKEARSFNKEVARGEKVFDRAVSNDSIKSIDQEHLDHVHKILSEIGYTKKSFQEPQLPLEELVRQSDRQLAVAYWLTDPRAKAKVYSDLTVSEFRALKNSIDSLMHVGKQAKLVESLHGTAEIENVAFDVAKAGERFDFIKQPLNKSVGQRIGGAWRFVQASGLLVERMLDYHDRFDPRGPITSFMDRPLRDSYNKELQLTEKVRDKLRAIEQYVDRLINEPITNSYIWDPRAGDYMNMTRKNLRQFILYMGSESGIEKVTKGFNIDPIAAWNLIKQNATKEDVAWANGMWAVHDMLWPEAAAMERRYTGVEPDGIEARGFKIKLKDGTEAEATGGYTPIVYDKARSTIEADIAKKGDLFDDNYFYSLSTPHGYTKPRTGYAGYLDLTGALSATKLQGMVHDIAFRESVRNASKLINNRTFMDAMTDRWGSEFSNLLRGWLRDIANVHNVDDSYAMGATAALAAIRQNVVSTLVFLNPGTFLKHTGTAMSMSTTQVGPWAFTGAMRKFGLGDILKSSKDLISSRERIAPDPDIVAAMKEVTDPGERGESVRQFIWDSSALMRNRQGPYMDTIRGAYERVNNAGLAQTAAEARQLSINIGRMPVALGDSLSAMPTWYAAYKKEFAASGDKADAINVADRAMTRAHGSKFIGDRPAFMRTANTFSGEVARWFTPLMSFWNHNFNNILQLAWDIDARAGRGAGSEPGASVGSITGRIIALAVVPILVEELAAPAISSEHGGIGRKMFMATLRFFGSYVPVLRDITNAAAGGYEPSVGLLGTVYRNLTSFGKDIANKGVGKTVSSDWFTHLTTVLGMTTGIGGSQAGRTVTGITGAMTGRERPRDLTEYRQLLRTGHSRPRGM